MRDVNWVTYLAGIYLGGRGVLTGFYGIFSYASLLFNYFIM